MIFSAIIKKIPLKAILLTFCIFMLLNKPKNISAQPIELAFDGMVGLSNYMLSEIYYPLVHSGEGDALVVFQPMYYNISVLREPDYGETEFSTKLKGKDFKGYGFGVTFGYAMTESLRFNINYIYNRSSGILIDGHETYALEGSMTNHLIHTGISYDFLSRSRNWSFLIGGNIFIQKNDMNFEIYPYPKGTPSSVYPWMPDLSTISSNEDGRGYTITIALSRKFSIFESEFALTPYLIAGTYTTKPNIYHHIPNNETQVQETGSDGIEGFGMRVNYYTDSNWSFSFSFTGFLNLAINNDPLSDLFYEGLRMKIVSISIVYNF